MSKPIVVQVKHGREQRRGITYQLERVLCGKGNCAKLHGPYWYAYWKAGGRVRKRYIGRKWKPLELDLLDLALGPEDLATGRARRGPRGKPALGNRAGPAELPKAGRRHR